MRLKTRGAYRAAYVITVLASIILLISANRYLAAGENIFHGDSQVDISRAVVRAIVDRSQSSREYDDSTTVTSTDITFYAGIQSGRFSGRTIQAIQTIDGFSYVKTKEIEPGDRVLLILNEIADNRFEWRFVDYVRTDHLLYLAAAFMIVLIVFGRYKGLNTILSLIFTCLAVFAVFIPSILSGKNIYLWSVYTCLYVVISTLLIISGFNRKTLAAAVGCLAGIAVTAAITLVMDRLLLLTGFLDEHSFYIVNLPLQNQINLKGIVFAAIVIGAMGAIMDVSVSIASSLWEIKAKVKNASFMTLYKSGITIGRDIMGTMSNTLILAYVGGSLSLVILLTAYSTSMLELFNREIIVAEMLKALTGSFGILLTMPLTAVASGFFYTKVFKGTLSL